MNKTDNRRGYECARGGESYLSGRSATELIAMAEYLESESIPYECGMAEYIRELARRLAA